MVANLFTNLKTIEDFRRADEEFQLKKQAAELDKQRIAQSAQGTPPAALQLANEYQKRMAAGDREGANLLAQFAKTVDKGVEVGATGYQPMAGYGEAIGSIGAQKKGMERQVEKDIDLNMNPQIAGREASARLQQQLAYEPIIDVAKTNAAETNKKANTAREAAPMIRDMLAQNERTFDIPNAGSLQGLLNLVPGTDAHTTAIDLMEQKRLGLAAPLAKLLGVNPTDKDFVASLNQIFNINSRKESREAQIRSLAAKYNVDLDEAAINEVSNLATPQPIPPKASVAQPTPPQLPKINPSNIPMDAVKDLRNNPASAAQFDEIFGAGASKMVLGR